MEQQGTVEYHLGQLTAAVEAMQTTVGDVVKSQGGVVTGVAVLAERVKNLPCEERLNSCRTHIIAVEKLCNGKARVCQSIKNRRSNIISAIIGGGVVALIELGLFLAGLLQH